MSAEREKLIREHWKRWRGEWPDEMPVLRMAVRKPLPASWMQGDVPQTDKIDILEFRREYGRQDGRKARRTVCEGIVVETVLES